MTLENVYIQWLENKSRQVKRSTVSTYQLIYTKVLRRKFENFDVESLDKKVIMSFMYNLIDNEGLSVKYCIDILIVFKMILRFACDELDLEVPNTSWKMNWPTASKEGCHRIERYTPSEYKKIVEYSMKNPSPRNLGILITICTGMRIGEICSLQWKDIDIANRMIHVSKTIERLYDPDNHHTFIEIGTTKTTTSDRYIPIMKDIYPLIKKFGSVCNPDYYVNTCSENFLEPRVYRNYYRAFILQKVRLDHCIKFHGLRHTFATTMIENKVDIKTTSAILGHADISTTLNIYVHPSDDVKRNAMNTGLKKIFKQYD